MLGEIHSRIDQSKEDILKFAAKMVAFKTPNPPARNTKEIQTWMAGELQKLGMKTEMHDLYPDEPLVVGIAQGETGQRTLVFNGHVDVAQIEEDEKWNFDPFSAKWDQKYFYGRGAADMKGALAAVFWAIKTVLGSGITLKNNLMFQSVVGEEAGEHGTKTLLEKGYKGDFAIVPEPTELKICGQGGVVTMWVILKSPQTFHDGLRSRLIHAGGGIDGANAIEKMFKVLNGMQELERHWAVMKSYPGLRPGANTINPAVIKGGRHPAFIADECALWFTIHYLPNEKMDDVKQEVVSHINALADADPWLKKNRPEVIFGGTSMFRDQGEIFPASEIDKNNPDVRRLLSTFKRVLGRKAETPVWPSVSDSGWFSEYGIPVVICGPGGLEEAHAINEKIEIDQVLEAAKLYAATIVDFCAR
ncbi:MAG: acetylornithine deacetylase [Proteobacteria bacterium]|nr:acetylornithine deacetylase [Pseudomonadota bacterium]